MTKNKPVRILSGRKNPDTGVWEDSGDIPIEDLWCAKHARGNKHLTAFAVRSLTTYIVRNILTDPEFQESVGGVNASREEVGAAVRKLAPLCCHIGDDTLASARALVVMSLNKIQQQGRMAKLASKVRS